MSIDQGQIALVYVVLGFAPDNLDCWVSDYGVESRRRRVRMRCGSTLAAKLSRPFGGLPASVVSVDAGYLTSVRCNRNVRGVDGGFRASVEVVRGNR